MAGTQRNTGKGGGRERHISVRAVRRNPPDLQKLSRALMQLAMAQAAAEADAQAEQVAGPSENTSTEAESTDGD